MKLLKDLKIDEKNVIVRADLDVPMKNGQVEDVTRLELVIPTVESLLERCKKVIVIGHLGRPEGRVVNELKMAPVALELQKLVSSPSRLEVLENLRFNSGEVENDPDYAKSIADLADFFVNDAFATAHREHASVVGIPNYILGAIGLQFEKEIKVLSQLIKKPIRPFVFVVGGSKLVTKLPLIEKLASKADKILVGGKLALEISKFCSPEVMARIMVAKLTSNEKDIAGESARQFSEEIMGAKTVVWNGPMGMFEQEENGAGTEKIALAVNKTSAYSVIGGGDTEAAATKFNAEDNIDHVSQGGGAMLSYLANGTLPALDAINNSLVGEG